MDNDGLTMNMLRGINEVGLEIQTHNLLLNIAVTESNNIYKFWKNF